MDAAKKKKLMSSVWAVFWFAIIMGLLAAIAAPKFGSFQAKQRRQAAEGTADAGPAP